MLDRLLHRLGRKTSTGRYIPEIDGLRFVCIAYVVLLHIQEHVRLYPPTGPQAMSGPVRWVWEAVAQGGLGVFLFFMISAFVLTLPFASHSLGDGPKVSLRRYYLRRLTRIEPPYFLVLVAVFLLAPPWAKGGSLDQALPHFIAGMLYAHNLVFHSVNPVNVPSWSLEVEVQFYALVPFLAGLLGASGRWPRRARMASVGLAGVLLQSLLTGWFGLTTLTVLNGLLFFMVGTILADVYVSDWKERPPVHWSWDLVSLLGWPALIALWGTGDWKAIDLLGPPLALALFMAVFCGPWTRRILTGRFVTAIGGMCYSIYLVHFVVIL